MRKVRDLVLFIVGAVALAFTYTAQAADVDLSLAWDPPIAGGPVTDYRATCTDSGGAVILDTVTAGTTATGSATNVAEGAGSCSVVARGPGGESPPAVAAWSISIQLPPGVPENFRITLSCSVVSGSVVCEQV